jgi:hypothetical protein
MGLLSALQSLLRGITAATWSITVTKAVSR